MLDLSRLVVLHDLFTNLFFGLLLLLVRIEGLVLAVYLDSVLFEH